MVEQHIINIRKARGFASNKKAATAMRLIRDYVQHHFKSNQVKISPSINHAIWMSGKSNIPNQITVQVTTQENIAYVELPEKSFSHPDLQPKETEQTESTQETETAAQEQEKETESTSEQTETPPMTGEEDIAEKTKEKAQQVAEEKAAETAEAEATSEQEETTDAGEADTAAESQLPEEVVQALKTGTVDEAKEALQQLNRDDMELAKQVEQQHKNRKTLLQFIESNMR